MSRTQHARRHKLRPPMRYCISCRLNGKRTWSNHYQCDTCLAKLDLPKPSVQSNDIPY